MISTPVALKAAIATGILETLAGCGLTAPLSSRDCIEPLHQGKLSSRLTGSCGSSLALASSRVILSRAKATTGRAWRDCTV
ncbi:hypothetical protein NL676_023663 [Syzygium grande]|nr:hypothetical protein NL676_023663 [Syzygium grande]